MCVRPKQYVLVLRRIPDFPAQNVPAAMFAGTMDRAAGRAQEYASAAPGANVKSPALTV